MSERRIRAAAPACSRGPNVSTNRDQISCFARDSHAVYPAGLGLSRPGNAQIPEGRDIAHARRVRCALGGQHDRVLRQSDVELRAHALDARRGRRRVRLQTRRHARRSDAHARVPALVRRRQDPGAARRRSGARRIDGDQLLPRREVQARADAERHARARADLSVVVLGADQSAARSARGSCSTACCRKPRAIPRHTCR